MPSRREWFVAIVAIGICADAVSRAIAQTSDSQIARAAPPLGSSECTPTDIYKGVGSCAALACHGRPGSAGSSPTLQNSYAVWASHDRHAKAYAVLFGARSKNIVKLLNGSQKNGAWNEPWEEARCLACHSLPPLGGRPTPTALLVDGVSCEACHGPAEKWLVAHTTAGWTHLGDERFSPRFGMRDMQDMVSRAETCVGCHVGEANPTKGVIKEVNHDLIAAGHPRLTFEFSRYLEDIPQHWSTPVQTRPNKDARAWIVGQVVAAEAAAKLRSAHEANQVIEFADRDCYSCHHQLQDKEWRKPRDPQQAARPSDPLRWSTWYTSNLSHLPETKGGSVAELLQSAHGRSTPPAAGTIDLSATARALESWIEKKDAAELGKVMAQIAQSGMTLTHWDDATQHYLALVALDEARRNAVQAHGGTLSPNDHEIRRKLGFLYKALRFHPIETSGQKESPQLDSPRDFDAAAIQGLMEKVNELLRPSADVPPGQK